MSDERAFLAFLDKTKGGSEEDASVTTPLSSVHAAIDDVCKTLDIITTDPQDVLLRSGSPEIIKVTLDHLVNALDDLKDQPISEEDKLNLGQRLIDLGTGLDTASKKVKSTADILIIQFKNQAHEMALEYLSNILRKGLKNDELEIKLKITPETMASMALSVMQDQTPEIQQEILEHALSANFKTANKLAGGVKSLSDRRDALMNVLGAKVEIYEKSGFLFNVAQGQPPTDYSM